MVSLGFLLLTAVANGAGTATGQVDPQATEIWNSVPVVVTPGAGSAPPSDAIILFDGSNHSAWEKGVGAADTYTDFAEFLQKLKKPGDPIAWDVKDGSMTVKPGSGYIKSKQAFGDVQLHVEWKSPNKLLKEGQDRGNSGIFLQGLYEVQVLDSYQHQTYSNGQAAAVYKQVSPLVNASLPPGQWQTYDIIFTAPVFGSTGNLVAPARVSVIHNGVLVQNNVSIWGPTTYRGVPLYRQHPAKLPLVLQDHNELVSFRNIWLREL
ncbi:DUF1080 domain-containing protein [Pseudomaricurvus alcaniphilus]|nr:DUF1080 domain-containing protein [Pseudomaricurvus alcaniphilus]